MKFYKHFVSTLTIVGLTLALASGAKAEQGFYVGGAFGQSYLDETIDGIRIDTDASSYRLYGGYGFTRYFGVEVAYLDLGTFRETIDVGGIGVPISASADGFSLAAVGTLPLGEKFSAMGRLGYYFHGGDSSVAGVSEKSPREESPFVGVGLAYDLTEVLEVNIGVDYINTKDADPTLATVGLTLRF